MPRVYWLLAAFTIFLLLLGIISSSPLYGVNWALMSVVTISLALMIFFWRFEASGVESKEIALVATMASLAAVSRVPFAALMSFQPTTFVVMITGYVFGARSGFMVGAAAALVSNFFLGQGPWTPWQMLCWGLCGVSAAVLANNVKEFKLLPFTVLAFSWGYLYGWIMNIWHWVGFVYPLSLETFLATYAASLPFDTLHAAGNILFSALLGRSFYRILKRYKNKVFVAYIN